MRESQLGRGCDFVLFLDPRVVLRQGSLEEMSRWISQPNIGIVGCRLHDAKGHIYHSGIAMSPSGSANPAWKYLEKGTPSCLMNWSNLQKVADAVSGSCMLIAKDTFLRAGGFDEVYYPSLYSDTDLAARLRRQGLHCFYTPYAEGIIHEIGASRIEDIEASYWLHKKANAARTPAPCGQLNREQHMQKVYAEKN